MCDHSHIFACAHIRFTYADIRPQASISLLFNRALRGICFCLRIFATNGSSMSEANTNKRHSHIHFVHTTVLHGNVEAKIMVAATVLHKRSENATVSHERSADECLLVDTYVRIHCNAIHEHIHAHERSEQTTFA